MNLFYTLEGFVSYQVLFGLIRLEIWPQNGERKPGF